MKTKLHAFIWREGDAWVSQCVEFNIASCGDTREEALSNLIEALELAREPPTDSSFVIPAGDFDLETVSVFVNE
jgi:predicted RNase H-like HicB family nuclease